jgi:hypothetical protein
MKTLQASLGMRDFESDHVQVLRYFEIRSIELLWCLDNSTVLQFQAWIETNVASENMKQMRIWLCNTSVIESISSISDFKQDGPDHRTAFSHNDSSSGVSTCDWQVEFLFKTDNLVDGIVRFSDNHSSASAWFRIQFADGKRGFVQKHDLKSVQDLTNLFSATQWDDHDYMDICYEP